MMVRHEARLGEPRHTDPGFEEFLADPMVRLLMRKDHIPEEDARRLFIDVATRLRSAGRPRSAFTGVTAIYREPVRA